MLRTCLLFPGQGAQYRGMGLHLYERYGFAKTRLAEASDAIGMDLLQLIREGTEEQLKLTANAQPAILATSYIAYEAIREETGLEPTYMAGHSLGEITALSCAGAISFYEAVRLVRMRGQFMQEAVAPGEGAMLSVIGLDAEQIARICAEQSGDEGIAVVSNYNADEQTVISGHRTTVERCAQQLQGAGGRIVPLNVSAPFHSPLMEKAAAQFRAEAEKLHYRPLQATVVSNVTAAPYEEATMIAAMLTAQLTAPVKWVQSMRFLASEGVVLAVDAGPSKVVANLLKKTCPGIKLFAYDAEDERDRLHQTFRHAKASKPSSRNFLSRCLAIAVSTPNTNWNNEEYEQGVSKPYKEIHRLQLQLDEEGRDPSEEEMARALDMLHSVFHTKRTPIEEQRMRYEQLMMETGTEHLFQSKEWMKNVAIANEYSV